MKNNKIQKVALLLKVNKFLKDSQPKNGSRVGNAVKRMK